MGLIEKFQNTLQGNRAMDAIQSAGDWISGANKTVQGWAGSLFSVASNGSTFVGMNYQSVPGIRDAIRAYVKNIQTIADGLNTDADANNAVHGEITEETKKYITAIKAVVDAYVSSLLIYSDKMQQYYEAYSKSDTTLASNVGQEAAGLTSTAQSQTYTERN